MNFSSMLGTLIIGCVIYFGVVQSSHNPQIFFNSHAIILVLGGTLGVTLLAFPIKRIKEVIDFILYGTLLKRKQDDIKNVVDIIRIAHFQKINPRGFLQNLNINYIFLKEAAVLLSKEKLSLEELSLILRNRRNSFKKRYNEDFKMLLAISKFPPGLGLLGASSGMIEMMAGLSSSGMESIGASMAVALVATFWGIACSNFIFLPLADYAHRIAQEDLFSRDIVLHGMFMIKQGFPVSSISEALISELPISDQMMLRNLIFKSRQTLDSENIDRSPRRETNNIINLDFLNAQLDKDNEEAS